MLPDFYSGTLTGDDPQDPTHPLHPRTLAQTILHQISYGDPWALGAWGVRPQKFILMSHKSEGHFYTGGIAFRVSGMKLRGWVVVKLRGDDLYSIVFWSMSDRVWLPVNTVEGIFCDQLMEVIDSVVER